MINYFFVETQDTNGFPKNLKLLRVARGLGQRELAVRLGTTLKTVSHWETGYSEPSIGQLIGLADFFDVTLDDLMRRG